MGKKLAEIFSFLKKNWKLSLIVLVGIFLVVISSVGGTNTKQKEEITLDEYRTELEGRVGAMCSSVSGVGKCKVLITFERGEQSTYKGSALLEVKPPRVLGVTVVCRGAESDRVRADLTEMLSALFDIGANRIAILKLNS